MTRALLILALVATAFWVYTIVDCVVQPPTRHRGVSKPIWILIVVFIPVLGGVLWLLVGRTRRATLAARRAPDDDPEFLGRIGVVTGKFDLTVGAPDGIAFSPINPNEDDK